MINIHPTLLICILTVKLKMKQSACLVGFVVHTLIFARRQGRPQSLIMHFHLFEILDIDLTNNVQHFK